MMKANDSILLSRTSNIALCVSHLVQELQNLWLLCRDLNVSQWDLEKER